MVERRRQTSFDSEVETFPSLVAVRFVCHPTGCEKAAFGRDGKVFSFFT
jgi:hypothetical protein